MDIASLSRKKALQSINWDLHRGLVTLAGTSAPPAVGSAQAKTDETWIIPETISANLYHSCGVKNDGTLACWGVGGDRTIPPAGVFTQVSAGLNHTCAVSSYGGYVCWGYDDYGESSPYEENFLPVLSKP